MIDATENPRFQGFMKLVDKHRTLGVRTNADTPQDAAVARQFGAEGIGLFRTEHMFYGTGSDQPLFLLAENDPQQARSRSRKAAARRVVPLRQGEHQGHAGGDGRPAGHGAAAGPAAARVRAAGPDAAEGAGRRRWASGRSRSRSAARPCTRPTP